MAVVKYINGKPLLSGRVGNDTIYKIVNGKQVVTKFPTPSKKKPSKSQKAARRKFTLAAAYAREIINDPVKKKALLKKKLKKGVSVYNAAFTEYFRKEKRKNKR